MNSLVLANGHWLAELSLSTIWLITGLVVSFLLGRHQARAHAVLVVTLIAMVITPLVRSSVTACGGGLLSKVPSQQRPTALPIDSTAEAEWPPLPTNSGQLKEVDNELAPDGAVQEELVGAPDRSIPLQAGSLFRLNPLILLFLAWGSISLVLAVRMVITTIHSRRLMASRTVVTDPRLGKFLDQAVSHLGLSRPPSLGSADIQSPIVWCWGRKPTILVPSNASGNIDGVDWVGIFRHELAHWVRGDHLTGLAGHILTVILPWHPLVWMAHRRLHELSEQVCDQWAIVDGRSPFDYAESLVKLQPEGRGHMVLAAVSSRKLLTTRVEQLLRSQQATPRVGRSWIVALTALAILTTIAIALAQPSPEVRQNDAKQESLNPTGVSQADEGTLMTVSGTAKLANGNPARNAKIAVIGRLRRISRGGDFSEVDPSVFGLTTADQHGSYQIKIQRTSTSTVFNLFALGAFPGHALGWKALDFNSPQPQGNVVLNDENPVRGRLIDLNGEPAKEVRLRVVWLGQTVNGKRDFILFAHPPTNLPLWPESLMSDSQGMFALPGLDRGQGVARCTDDPRFAKTLLLINVNNVEPKKEDDPVFTLSPSQIVEGVITAADTGEPIPNSRITVFAGPTKSGAGDGIDGQSDDQGRFEMNPYAAPFIAVTAYAPDGQPYLTSQKVIEWPKGAKRQSITLAMPRGVLVRGKVINHDDRKPIPRAGIEYRPSSTNPNLGSGLVSGWSNLATSDDDGIFQLTVPLGEGTLLIKGPGGDYIHQEIGDRMIAEGKAGGNRLYPDAVVPLNIPTGSTTQVVEAVLNRGATVRGTLVGPEGQPIENAIMVWRSHLSPYDFSWRSHEEITGEFELHGCDPNAEYDVMFLDATHEWGTTAKISGSSQGKSLTIRLQPCATATGRYFGKDNMPLAKARPFLELVVTPGTSPVGKGYRAGTLSADVSFVANSDRLHYGNGPVTDMDGRMIFPALIPGATYRVGSGKQGQYHEWVAKSGENFELPDTHYDDDR